MTQLYIAEKPSLARAIADALPAPHRRHEGYIEVGNGDLVTWCFGHLLEQVDPHHYDARYQRWSLHDLPIVPTTWQVAPRSAAKKQLAVIRQLLKSASAVIHAGDPDREGQLLVDEVIAYLRYPAAKRAQVQRLLVSDLNVEAVKKSLRALRPNSEFAPLSTSALARSRADWLYGINMSRAYTLLGQMAGYEGVLSVGRVQTPVLGLVVRRDQEIEAFVSKPYYEVQALIPHQGQIIKALWKPSEACAPYQDAEGRVLHRPLAENVVARITGQPAQVLSAKHNQVAQAPPLPYSLSALQIDAARRFHMSAADVLSACQALYEKHKAITYPRSDCRYLPVEHHAQAGEVSRAIADNAPSLRGAVGGADLRARSKAWDDSKVGAHHAIIPTPVSVQLSGAQAKIYELIARQYLMQFYPAALYGKGELVFAIAGGTFIASGSQLLRSGWRELLGHGHTNSSDTRGAESADGKRHTTERQAAAPSAYVPELAAGTILTCQEGVILDKRTEPPKPFTDATLLQAMTGIARFVADAELRKILRETDGLGTEATRASILETLFSRTLLLRQGKDIRASAAGRGLIAALPASATYPDMTAHWEKRLRDMAERSDAYGPFMSTLESQLRAMLESPCRGEVPAGLRELKAVAAPKRKRGGKGRRRSKAR